MSQINTAATDLNANDIPDKTLSALFNELRQVHKVTRSDIGQIQFTLNTLKTAVSNGELKPSARVGVQRYFSTNDGLKWVESRKARILRKKAAETLERGLARSDSKVSRHVAKANHELALAVLAEIDAAIAELDN